MLGEMFGISWLGLGILSTILLSTSLSLWIFFANLPRIAEMLPRTKPRTKPYPRAQQKHHTLQRGTSKLPLDRETPQLQKRAAAVLPPKGVFNPPDHLVVLGRAQDSWENLVFLENP